jgi:hypothetical protein
MIGAQPPNGLGPLKGQIDEVAIYDAPLTEKEVQKLASGLAATFFAVEPIGKLAASLGKMKARR